MTAGVGPLTAGVDAYANRRLDLGELIAYADTATPWRCEGIASDGYLTVLTGRGGEGKSMLTLGLAGGVLCGRSVAGIGCTAGRVVIFDAENGPKLIGRRLKATGIAHTGLEVYDADGLDLAGDASWIRDQVAGAQLAVFDSLRTLSPGAAENDGDDMAPRMVELRRLARQTGAAIIVVHHRGRDDSRDYRGSSVIHDQADVMIVLERDQKDPERQWRRCLRPAKCRIDAEPEPRWVGIQHHQGQVTFTEAAPHAADTARPRRSKVADQVLSLLDHHGPATRSEIARKLDRTRTDGTVGRALEQLEQAGQISRNDDHWRCAKPQMAHRRAGTPPNASNDGQNEVCQPSDGTPGTGTCATVPPPVRGGTWNGTPQEAHS